MQFAFSLSYFEVVPSIIEQSNISVTKGYGPWC